jgi:hypothetical protein
MIDLDAMFDEYTPLRPESQKLANFRIVNIAVERSRCAFGCAMMYADAIWNGHEWVNLDFKSKSELLFLYTFPADLQWTENTPITRVIENESAKL